MKAISLLVLCMITGSAYCFGEWSEQRLESFLRTSGRFVDNDYDGDYVDDIPNWERDALPLFRDVLQESGWSTNQLVQQLISIASNGLSSANWECPLKRRSTAVALAQLSDINHPAVTNYFRTVVGSDLHGLESVVVPGLFKYSYLEPEVFEVLYQASSFTNSYRKAASEVAMALLDGLERVPINARAGANVRVAKFMYRTMRQVESSQTWQDGKLANLITDYSNSVQRLNQMRYFLRHSTNSYERAMATQQYNRLCSLPTNCLNNVSWLAD